jgi:hypothetical protein
MWGPRSPQAQVINFQLIAAPGDIDLVASQIRAAFVVVF